MCMHAETVTNMHLSRLGEQLSTNGIGRDLPGQL